MGKAELGLKIAAAASLTFGFSPYRVNAEEPFIQETPWESVVYIEEDNGRVGGSFNLIPSGAKWKRKEIGLNSNDSVLLIEGKAAFDIWADQSGLIEANEGENINISFIDEKPSHWGEYQVAEAGISVGNDKEAIEYCYIHILEDSYKEDSESLKQTLLVHEVGHCLGIDHSDERPSIMTSNIREASTELESDDIEAIQFLYGPPEVLEQPSISKPDFPDIELKTGWNLITLEQESKNPSNCGCEVIYGFDNEKNEWRKWFFQGDLSANTLDGLKAGQAYFIYKEE